MDIDFSKYDPIAKIFDASATVLNPPRLKLSIPKISTPSRTVVFVLVFISYFFVLSGVIYDIIVEPPSIGSTQDPDGRIRPVAILPYRVNGQYVVEGLTAGFLFCVGGAGFILLDLVGRTGPGSMSVTKKGRLTAVIVGMVMVALSYNIAIMILRIKVPGYLSR